MRNWAENKINTGIRIVLIRHGATKGNEEHRYLGTTDEALSEAGSAQLERLRTEGRYPQVDYLFASPMKRCIQTAQICYPQQTPRIIPEWVEMDFGDFEGKNYQELQHDKRYQAWIDSQATLPFPNGESREEFVLRCERGLMTMLEKLAEIRQVTPKPRMTVGVIVHGGTIMALLSSFYGGDYFDYQVANGSGYRVQLQRKQDRYCFQEVLRL